VDKKVAQGGNQGWGQPFDDPIQVTLNNRRSVYLKTLDSSKEGF